jgi:ABC-type multidrug transport system ATPase subunit
VSSAVLQFVVDMKIAGSAATKAKKIEEISQELNITKCLDTRIGTFEIKGISGGEMRRLSIAEEILYEPQVLFLDEPTSGLDSFNALLVISILKRLAK